MHISTLSVAAVLDSLHTSERGLDDVEAQRRLQEYGRNRIDEIKGAPQWRRLLGEFTHFFAFILWIAAGLAFFAESRNPGEGMAQLGFAIVSVILVNGAFSYWQEYRAERAIAALRELLPHYVKVMRGGQLCTLTAEELVPGDVVLLEEGDNVPADCRLIAGTEIRVNTSTLTGESLPKARSPEAEEGEPRPASDARNLLLAGTSLVSGQGRAVVFATAMATEFGKIARLTQTADKTVSHLQQEIARMSRLVALFATFLGVVFFAVGAWIGLPYWTAGMFAIGIIVANVPEGLLPTLTLSLAMATQRMARRNALVRHLPAVETLGATTVICSDKTGTLTQNRMDVHRIFAGDLVRDADQMPRDRAFHLLRNARHCHTLKRAQKDGQSVWLGDPMEVALCEFASNGNGNDGQPELVGSVPFDAERRRMSVVLLIDGERWLYCKGAPEAVLPLCDRQEHEGGELPFDPAARHRAAAAQETMAGRGLRVLAFAYRKLAPDEAPAEQGLVFSGLIGLFDPPRPEVPAAIERCRTAGIKVVMITGDHPHTAVAVARHIGLVRGRSPSVILGEHLARMSASQLQLALDTPEVLFARMTAEQKMRVVQAFKNKGEIVAATGDGVNDAPALKSAHIGIAMGQAGTDVAKAAADMILLDDNFASIVNAVEEGRAVFENIRKFLTYILTSNIPELVPYLAFVLFAIPLPLTVIQILAIDLGTDMLPALALGAEWPHAGLMNRPPRPAKERLLSWPLLMRAYLWLGMLEAGAALAMFFLVLHWGGWHYGQALSDLSPLYRQATTACLAAIVAAQMVNLFLCRHPDEAAWRFPLTQNPLLLAGLIAESALLLIIVYTPVGHVVFATAAFAPSAWLWMAGLALLFGTLEETRKFLLRRSRHQP